MEDVEIFLSSLTARSKVREVLRGLVATRQVHTISLGHAPHFYVAGTLPEFDIAPTAYSSSSMPASAYFMRSFDRQEEIGEPEAVQPLESVAPAASAPPAPRKPIETHAPRTAPTRKPSIGDKSSAARPHFSLPATHTRDRKPAQASSVSRRVRHTSSESRPGGARPANGTRPSTASRSNGRTAASPTKSATGARTSKSAAPAWSQRNGHSNGANSAAKPGASSRSGNGVARGVRKDSRPDSRSDARPARSGASRKPALTAGTKAGNSKRFGFTARPKQGTKKDG